MHLVGATFGCDTTDLDNHLSQAELAPTETGYAQDLRIRFFHHSSTPLLQLSFVRCLLPLPTARFH